MLGIVTVYASENCGSFLQAYALQHSANQFHTESVCVQYQFPDNPSALKKFLPTACKSVIKGDFKALSRTVAKRKNFQTAAQRLKTKPADTPYQCCVLGSDTIWDISSSFFRNHYPFFWGTHE